MLGVTSFGIFLTPVFFNVIDWLGSARLFADPWVRRVSEGLLIVMTFGLLWVVLRLEEGFAQRAARQSAEEREQPEENHDA
jgi:hypothetical protein